MYQFYIVIVAIGIVEIIMMIDSLIVKTMTFVGKGIAGIFTVLIMINVILSGLSIVKFSLLPNTLSVAMNFLEENGITEENTLYEGYTPFAPSATHSQVSAFIRSEEGIEIGIQNATKKYFMMSDSFKNRYLAHPDGYSNECVIYNGLEETYDIIYRESPDGNYKVSKSIWKNIVNSLKYLAGNQTATGRTITVYDMNPKYLSVQTKDGKYLCALSEEHGTEIHLSDEAYAWVEYDDQNKMYTLLSGQSGLALDVMDGNFSADGKLQLWDASGEIQQQWNIVEEDDYCYLVVENNMALTYYGDNVILTQYTKSDNQKWYLRDSDY